MKIVDTVLITLADPFVDTLSSPFIISSHIIVESSIVLVKYSAFSQLHAFSHAVYSF